MSREADTSEWTRTPADERAVAAGCWFDVAAAERIREFMRRFLRHSKGDFGGKPFELLDWQWRELVAPLFGWRRPDDSRRDRCASCWVAKKQGKTTLASALVLVGLLGDGEKGASVYSAAADREQASLVYHEAAMMVRQSPALAKYLEPLDTIKRIIWRSGGAFYQVLSKESRKTGHGINASMVVLDELHVVGRELYDTLKYAGAARRQPLYIEISTAGNDKDSIGYERYLFAKRVRDGEVDAPELLPVIYEADPAGDWEDPVQLRKANPSLGVTVTEDSFRADFNEARQGSAPAQATFKQFRLNQWQDSVSAWFPPELWDACEDPMPEDALSQYPCWGAIDIASKMDLVACVWLFGLPDDKFYFLPRFWCPEDADSARQRTNKQMLKPWVQSKRIRIGSNDTYSGVIDQSLVLEQIIEDANKFRPIAVAYDPWNIGDVANGLAKACRLPIVEFPQGFKHFNGPMKQFEVLVKSGRARHDGNPVMRFCIKNVMVRPDDNDNIRPSKGKSADKIDGVTGAVMTVGISMTYQVTGKYYETHDVEIG